MEPREGEVIRADLVVTGASEVLVCPAYARARRDQLQVWVR